MIRRALPLILGAAAILACAWFALGAVQALDTSRATALLSGGSITPRQAADARSRLDTAATLNPDQTVNLLRGRLAFELGREAQARKIIASVTRAEPQNLQAWLALAHSSPHAPRVFLYALRRIALLMPPLPKARR